MLEDSLASKLLNLRDQQPRAAPGEIFQLVHLETLDLAHNEIGVLPSEVCHLAHLKKLYLEHNRLTTLPNELYKLSQSLTLLGIAHNPLEDELMQLYYAGLPVLLAHLRATRVRRLGSPSAQTVRSAGLNVEGFDLFSTNLPHYSFPPADTASLDYARTPRSA